jgi:hypothetical protein
LVKRFGQSLSPIEKLESVSFPPVAHAEKRLKFMKAEEFDTQFDRGEDITEALDLSRARRPGHEQKRVNVDLPVWVIAALDQEAHRIGVTRQAIIKVWLAERLEQLSRSVHS